MDTRDGRIYLLKEIERASAETKRFLKPMTISPTEEQLSRKPPRVNRNEPCPCGSGKKFKNCCRNTPNKSEEK